VSATAAAVADDAAAARPLTRRLDGFEAAALATLAALAMAVLGGLLLKVWLRGGVVTGGDGFLVADPMQYLDWARQAGEHGLIGNRQDLAPGDRAFLHPGLLGSGLLWRLGAGPALAYLVWKPVAVGVLFAGALALVRRFLERRDDRRLALVLALFACSPVAAIVGWGGLGQAGDKLQVDFVTGELWAGSYLWGYLFTAIAVGLLPLALIAYERARDGGAARWTVLAAGGGLLCAWLQPWQGATFALAIAAAEVVLVRRGRAPVAAARDLLVPLVATAAPLTYYALLGHFDAAWAHAGEVNDMPRWAWWVLVLGLLPLAAPAAFAYRLPAADFGAVALRAWPLAALVVYFAPFGTFPFHALQGLTLPLVVLGVLALRAWLGTRAVRLWPAVGAVLALVAVGTTYRVWSMADAVHVGRQPFTLTAGERAALRHLDALPEPGGVLAPVFTGIAVPAYTGRETWIGAGSWTPDQPRRTEAAEALFGGRLDAAAAEALVHRSGARFLLSDCHGRADIGRLVARFTDPPRRFGCAVVWRVR
jgi:hypothetical protein